MRGGWNTRKTSSVSDCSLSDRPDQAILCEDVFPEKGTLHLGATHCGSVLDSFGLTVVGIKGINLKVQVGILCFVTSDLTKPGRLIN